MLSLGFMDNYPSQDEPRETWTRIVEVSTKPVCGSCSRPIFFKDINQSQITTGFDYFVVSDELLSVL